MRSFFASRAVVLGVILATSFGLYGCIPSDSKTTGGASGGVEATPGQIIDTLKKMSATPEAYSDTAERHILTEQLAQMGPTALAPLIDFMGAPDTSGPARLFVLQCINNYLTPAYLPNLKPMLESTDETIRAVGFMAVGHIKNDDVAKLLVLARNDPSPRVAFSALSGLAMQGDAAAREELKNMYTSGTTTGTIKADDIKREVVRVLLRDVQQGDLPILQDALNQQFIAINARVLIAEALGRMGDKSAIPLLEQSLNLQKEPEYGEMVKQAITAINDRESHA